MKTLVTHDGAFHSSGVVAIALLKYFTGNVDVVRTRDPKVIGGADMAVDVGGVYSPDDGQFDLRQEAYEGNLTSAGMVAEWLSHQGFFIPSGLKRLINLVDRNGTGETRSEVAFIETIKSLNHYDIHSPTQESKFMAAVGYVVAIVEFIVAVESTAGKTEPEEATSIASSGIDEGVIVFTKGDHYVSPLDKLIGIADISVQWLSGSSCWVVQTIPLKAKKFETKYKLSPTNREDEISCHKAGFIARYHAIDGAIRIKVNGELRTIPVED